MAEDAIGWLSERDSDVGAHGRTRQKHKTMHLIRQTSPRHLSRGSPASCYLVYTVQCRAVRLASAGGQQAAQHWSVLRGGGRRWTYLKGARR